MPERLLSTAADAVRTHRGLAVVLGIGLVVRLALLAGTADTPLHVADERHYAQLASSLVRGGGFAFEPGRPTSMRPPLYPFFIASIWWITGSESLQAVRAVQAVLGLLLAVCAYAIAARLFDRRAAVAAAAVACFYPSLLFSGILLLTEVLFTLLLLLFVWQYQRFVDRPAAWAALSLGLLLGLAALTRSVLWPFPLVLLPLLVLAARGPTSRRLLLASACLAGYAAVVAPWAIRNTHLQRTLTIVDTMGGMNLLMGNYEHTPEDRMWDGVALLATDKSWSHGLDRRHPESATWTDGQKEKWAQREALAYMLAHPATTLRRSLLKFADFWGLEREMAAGLQQGLYRPPRWLFWFGIAAVAVAFPLVVLSAPVGLARARRESWRVHVLILAVIAFVTAVHSIVFGHSRYHLPLVPLLAVYAAAAWTGGRWRVAGRPAVLAGLLLIWAGLLAIWSREVLVRDAERIQALLRTL